MKEGHCRSWPKFQVKHLSLNFYCFFFHGCIKNDQLLLSSSDETIHQKMEGGAWGGRGSEWVGALRGWRVGQPTQVSKSNNQKCTILIRKGKGLISHTRRSKAKSRWYANFPESSIQLPVKCVNSFQGGGGGGGGDRRAFDALENVSVLLFFLSRPLLLPRS